jgi:hypothetical protein
MIIPKELDYIIKQQKRKDAKERIIKVYEALLYKRGKNNTWFDCPSAYLKKISGQYNMVMPLLLEYGIIEYKSINNDYKYTDIFTSNLHKKKFYYPSQSIKYRFLIDVTEGYEYDLEIPNNLYDNEGWFIKTKYSLLQIGFKSSELIIKKDNFSRRLHTNITGFIPEAKTYRELLCGGDYYVIDSKTSQPRLLWLHLKEIGLQDEKLNYIFDNGLDFYDYIIERIPALTGRDDAKELFTSWINGTGYLDADKSSIRNIFCVTNTFLRNYKTTSYKNVCKLLQYKEASIFIDDLLNNAPVDFCLSVHDSLIVKKEDSEKVLDYCKSKYTQLIFTIEEVKKK